MTSFDGGGVQKCPERACRVRRGVVVIATMVKGSSRITIEKMKEGKRIEDSGYITSADTNYKKYHMLTAYETKVVVGSDSMAINRPWICSISQEPLESRDQVLEGRRSKHG